MAERVVIGNCELWHGDCREVLPLIGKVDAVVADPPYGLSFMNRQWDYDVPTSDLWRLVLATMKPGAHLLSFAGTRTQHRMAVNIEDAGFDIRDMIAWVYGSGFPKSLDVSKAIDKAAGAERDVVATVKKTPSASSNCNEGWVRPWAEGKTTMDITAPATDAAKQWEGWGTALKPALEPITVARKPLISTVAKNVLAHGTGAINVERCRIEGRERTEYGLANSTRSAGNTYGEPSAAADFDASKGRWPANLIHDGSDEVVGLFPVTTSGARKSGQGGKGNGGTVAFRGKPNINDFAGDSGSAARFFYCAKASKADRDEVCERLEAIHRANGNKWTDQDYRVINGERPPSAESGPRRNHHPTVKPTALMRYLCRLVTPPGGIVLDPFMGSGSTGKAAVLEGFRFVGIEREREYFDIACERIARAQSQATLFPSEEQRQDVQLDIFQDNACLQEK